MVGITFVLCVVFGLASSYYVKLVGASSSGFKIQAPPPDKMLVEIERRLKRDVEMDWTRCHKTQWGEAYAELHKKLLSSSTGKKLVAVPHLSGE